MPSSTEKKVPSFSLSFLIFDRSNDERPTVRWNEEFQSFRGDQLPADAMKSTDAEFEKAFQQASESQWAQEFDKQENGWAHEFNGAESQSWADELIKFKRKSILLGIQKKHFRKRLDFSLMLLKIQAIPSLRAQSS
ncbi:hypothetical protein BC829DRAFT_22971 [Chytridium lagenaria]|nr:hypothetical protein BC829DRAFT_22971 [Chytridium lagenaria]